MEYPKAKYHANEPVRVVKDADEDALLGPDWFDNPNHVNNPPAPEPPDFPPAPETVIKRGPGRPRNPKTEE